jgi:hypothetical protein
LTGIVIIVATSRLNQLKTCGRPVNCRGRSCKPEHTGKMPIQPDSKTEDITRNGIENHK